MFPIVGISVLLSGMIFIYQSKTVGLFGIAMTVMIVANFIPDSYKFLLAMTFFLIEYHLIVNYSVQLRKRRNLIYNLICIFALVSVFWQVLQYKGIMILFYVMDPDHLTGTFANRNETSIFMALALPFFFRRRWCWLIPAIIAGLYLSKTMNGVIGAGIACSGYVFYKYWNQRGYKATLAMVLAIFVPLFMAGTYMKYIHFGSVGQRIDVYTRALPLIAEKPLMGWGIGQSQWIVPLYMGIDNREMINYALEHVYYPEDLHRLYMAHKDISKSIFSKDTMWAQLHNDYEQFAIDAGLVGLLLLLAVIISHTRGYFKTGAKDIYSFLSLIAILWTANAFFTFQIGRFTFLAVMFLAFIRSDYKDQQIQ